MKFYKRLPLDQHNPTSNRFAVKDDGEIITTSEVSMQLPSGDTTYRPGDSSLPAATATEGMIRHNTDLQDPEGYFRGTWERIRTVRPATITVQNLGNGNYSNYYFGPLNPDYEASYIAGSANIQTYVDNVFQIPETNYTVVPTPADVSKTIMSDSTAGSYTIEISDWQNVLVGARVVADNITTGTVVVATRVILTNTPVTATFFYADISIPTPSNVTSGTTATFVFTTGTYIAFTGSPPAKPVVAILGTDGYFPAS